MRITGGSAKGRSVAGPAGLEARPTGSKVRQAFFNILGPRVRRCRFLDLFAGSGLMGLEALSRGAAMLVAVDESRKMTRAIEANLKRLGFEGEVVSGDVRRVLPLLAPERFDVIYVDPPYKSNLAAAALHAISRERTLDDAGVVAVEYHRGSEPPDEVDDLVLYDRRVYGQTAIAFYRWRTAAG